MTEYVLWFDQVSMGDVERVGGKNAFDKATRKIKQIHDKRTDKARRAGA